MFIAQQCLQAGAWDHALAVAEACAEPAEPSVRLCHAVASFVAGEAERALAEVDALLAEQPQHLSALAVKAQMLARSGRAQQALAPLLALTARYPDYPGAHGLLSTLLLPGPHYREVLARIHARLKPRVYLEIGIESGATLSLAKHSQLVLGVDPARYPLRHALPAGTRVFHEESDTFFLRPRASVLAEQRVALAFIDGMHRFENALSDFANCESWAAPTASIVFHDCVPLVARTATRERGTKFWVGDTWKVVLALRAFRPELSVHTILCPPSGLVVVRGLDPTSTLLRARFAEIVAAFAAEQWQLAPGRVPPEFGAVANDEQGLATALGQAHDG